MSRRRRRHFQDLKPAHPDKFLRPERERARIEFVNLDEDDLPHLRITRDAHSKMLALVDVCDIEISWLSTIRPVPEVPNALELYDVFVPRQECSGSWTEKLSNATFDGEDELIRDMVTQRRYDVVRNLLVWGHSHVSMPVFTSQVDVDTARDMCRRAFEAGKTRFVQLVANKHGEMYAIMFLLDEGKIIHHVPIVAEEPAIEHWRRWAKHEIADKVTVKKWHGTPMRWKGEPWDPKVTGDDDDRLQDGSQRHIGRRNYNPNFALVDYDEGDPKELNFDHD